MLSPVLLLAFHAAAAQELRVPSAAGHEIAATLEGVVTGESRPTVVLIAGAGPLDRDGYTLRTTAGHNDAYRAMSRRFTALGFAVVRFDKVGTGRSTGDYRATATTASLAEDVRTLVATVRSQPGVDPARIFLLGHSEGGAIAGRVAAVDPDIAGVALLAAPAWTGRRIMEYQFRFAALRQHRRVSYTSAELIEASLVGDARARLASEAWYPHFLDYDPLPPFRRLQMPVLILQGERDEVVLASQADELAATLRSAGNADVSLFVLPDYGHAFTARGDRRDPAPVSDEVLGLVERWLGRVAAPRDRGAVPPR
jgi:pimeloyl-ACP methyl ester carboxylesterase